MISFFVFRCLNDQNRSFVHFHFNQIDIDNYHLMCACCVHSKYVLVILMHVSFKTPIAKSIIQNVANRF